MERISQLKQLLELDDQDADVMYMLGQEHNRAGRFDEAADWYDRCIQTDPSHTYAYFHKARALESKGDVEAAKSTLRDGLAAAEEADDEKALEEIGVYLSQLEDED